MPGLLAPPGQAQQQPQQSAAELAPPAAAESATREAPPWGRGAWNAQWHSYQGLGPELAGVVPQVAPRAAAHHGPHASSSAGYNPGYNTPASSYMGSFARGQASFASATGQPPRSAGHDGGDGGDGRAGALATRQRHFFSGQFVGEREGGSARPGTG